MLSLNLLYNVCFAIVTVEPVFGLEPESREVLAAPAEEAIVSCRVLPGEGNEVSPLGSQTWFWY